MELAGTLVYVHAPEYAGVGGGGVGVKGAMVVFAASKAMRLFVVREEEGVRRVGCGL